MKVTLKWLSEYVDIDMTAGELADLLTMTGTKVEDVEEIGGGLSGIIAARIDEIGRIPGSEGLFAAKVDTGSGQAVVVTAATNLKAGDLVPLALPGAVIAGGREIGRREFLGVESYGMLLSAAELGLEKESEGILLLGMDDFAPGTDLVAAAGFHDWVIDLEITPNRPDCLSVYGVAREIAAITGRELKAPKWDLAGLPQGRRQASDYVTVKIESPELCRRYSAGIVTDVKVGPSPLWMQWRLAAVGQRPISNIVDVTNYVMFELGQPLHAFDLGLVEGQTIIVRTAKPGERIVTLDGEERELDGSVLVIADARRPQAVAGVMGGSGSEVGEATSAILLESAHFDKVSIWKTSKKLKLRTEASSRFEKGLDPSAVIDASRRARYLFAVLGAGVPAPGEVDVYARPLELEPVRARVSRINAVLGAGIDREFMASTLMRLGFGVSGDGDDLIVSVPGFRQDVSREADIIEEIARVYGYNRVASSLPKGASQGRVSPEMEFEFKIREALTGAGFSEAVSFPMVSPEAFDRMRIPEKSPLRDAMKLLYPLSQDFSILRTSVIPSVVEVLARNRSRRVDDAKVFEIGRGYRANPAFDPEARGVSAHEDYERAHKGQGLAGLPEPVAVDGGPVDLSAGYQKTSAPANYPALETRLVCGGMVGHAAEVNWASKPREVDFFDLKGVVEALLSRLGVGSGLVSYVKGVHPSLHPGRTAYVLVGGRPAGVMGELHPAVADSYNISARTYVFELNIDVLMDAASGLTRYEPIPKFPTVQRDVAAIAAIHVKAKDLIDTIKRAGGELVRGVTLFDVYEGAPVPEGHRSLAFSVQYRAEDRTLTDEEVNAAHGAVRSALGSMSGVSVR